MARVNLLISLVFVLRLACAYVPQEQLPDCINHLDNYICGVYGRLPRARPDKLYTNVTTLDACRIECLQRRANGIKDRCFALGYNKNAQTCSLFHRSLLSYGFQANSSSPQIFYSGMCFDCLTTCPPQGQDNLLVNPDFDAPIRANSTGSPWNDQGPSIGSNNVALVSPGYSSPSAWSCTGYCAQSQTLDLCEGGLYELTFDYRLDTTTTDGHYLRIFVGDLVYYLTLTIDQSGQWYPFFDTFTARHLNAFSNPTPFQAYNFNIMIDGGRDTHVTIDNFAIRPARKATATPGSLSLLQNGDFENGKLAPWRDSGSPHSLYYFPSVAPTGYKSNDSVTVGGKHKQAGARQPISQFQQQVTLVPHSKYILSLTYKKIGQSCLKYDDTYRHGAFIQFDTTSDGETAGNTNIIYWDLLFAPPALDQWITIERPFIAVSNVTYVRFYVNEYDDCVMYLDNISLRTASF